MKNGLHVSQTANSTRERHGEVQRVQEDQRVVVPAQVAVEQPPLEPSGRRRAEADHAIGVELRPVERVGMHAVGERARPLVDEHAERERREVADEAPAAAQHERGGERHEEHAELVRMTARRGEPEHRQGHDDGE